MLNLKDEYESTFGPTTLEVSDIKALKLEWLEIFKENNKTAKDWSRFLGLHHNTFRDFFTKDTMATKTIMTFARGLQKYKRGCNIDKK